MTVCHQPSPKGRHTVTVPELRGGIGVPCGGSVQFGHSTAALDDVSTGPETLLTLRVCAGAACRSSLSETMIPYGFLGARPAPRRRPHGAKGGGAFPHHTPARTVSGEYGTRRQQASHRDRAARLLEEGDQL